MEKCRATPDCLYRNLITLRREIHIFIMAKIFNLFQSSFLSLYTPENVRKLSTYMNKNQVLMHLLGKTKALKLLNRKERQENHWQKNNFATQESINQAECKLFLRR